MSEIQQAIKELDVDRVRQLVFEPNYRQTRGQKRARISSITSKDEYGFCLVGQALKHIMPDDYYDAEGMHVDKHAQQCPGTCCAKLPPVKVGKWERSTEPRDVVIGKVGAIVKMLLETGHVEYKTDVIGGGVGIDVARNHPLNASQGTISQTSKICNIILFILCYIPPDFPLNPWHVAAGNMSASMRAT